MKLRHISAIILAMLMVVSTVGLFGAFAESQDQTDSLYYETIFLEDFESKTDAVTSFPTTGALVTGNYQEEDGNKCTYAYRVSGSNWDKLIFQMPSDKNSLSSTTEGEWVLESKVKFLQTSTTNKVCDLTMQIQTGGIQYATQFGDVNADGKAGNNVKFKGNVIGSTPFKSNVWYTIRNTYNFDTAKARVEIYSPEGNILTKTADLIGYNKSDALIGSWDRIVMYAPVSTVPGNAVMYDDITVLKAVKKPVTVKYDNTYGSVKYNGEVVESGDAIAVPYNSDSEIKLTVEPKSEYMVKDVTVGGVSVGNTTEISLKNITGDTEVEVSFKKAPLAEPRAPIVSNVKIIGTAMVTRELSVDFDFSDENEDEMTGADYSWELSADGKTDWETASTGETFTLTEEMIGKSLRVGIVAKTDAAELSNSEKTYSDVFGPVFALKEAPSIKEGSAKINGSGNVSDALIANYTYVYDKVKGDVEGDTEFVWESADSADGEYTVIPGENSKVFCPSSDYVKKYVRVKITPVDVNGIKGETAVTEPIVVSADASVFFVATDGSDDNTGTYTEPFATISKAKSVVRSLVSKGLTAPVYVNVRGGDYYLDAGLVFDGSDSGTEQYPITYRAYNGETVNLLGSKKLDASKITKVTDEKILNKLIEAPAREHLYQVKMSDLGIDAPALGYNGQNRKNVFILDNTELTNARWPNLDESGGEHTFIGGQAAELTEDEEGKYNGDSQPIKFNYFDDTNRSSLWEFKENDMFIGGGISYLWAAQVCKIGMLDPENKILKSSENFTYGQATYTAKDDRYLYFENIMEEIDVPGESYLDRETDTLYLYPAGEITEDSRFSLTTLSSDVINCESGCNLVFDGLNIKETTGTGALFGGLSNNVTVKNADFAFLGVYGIRIYGYNKTIENCNFYNIPNSAIMLNGGDKTSLTSSGNVVNNNVFRACSGTCNGAIEVSGVGHIVKNNKFYDYDRDALRCFGVNNIVIEYNEFYDCAQLNSDAGVIYFGRRVGDIGNIIRYNYFHEYGGHVGTHGQQAIFTDDGQVGPAIYGNIMYNPVSETSYPFKTHAGQFHWIHDNIFIGAKGQGLFMQMWPRGWTQAQDKREGVGRWFFYIQDIGDDILSTGKSGMFATYKDLLFSDTWYKYYTEEEPTGQWKSMLENYINKDMYAKLQEAYANSTKENSKALTDLVNTIPNEYTNKLWNNVYIDIRTPVSGGNYSYETSAQFTLEDGKKLFKDFGSDFTLTSDGLATIREQIPEFESVDFSKIGLEESANEISAPKASNVKITGNPKAGNALTAKYDYESEAGIKEGLSKVYWYVSDKEDGKYERITRGYGPALTLTEDYENKYVRYEVVPVDSEYRYDRKAYTSEAILVSDSTSADKTELWDNIGDAVELIDGVEVGNKPGQYPQSAVDSLEKAISEAKQIANTQNAFEYQISDATDVLKAAIDEFIASVVPDESKDADKTRLEEVIAEAEGFVKSAKTGTGYGEYTSSVIASLNTEINLAKQVNSDDDATASDVNDAVLKLRNALNNTKGKFNQSGVVSSNGTLNLNYNGEKAEITVGNGVNNVEVIVEKGAQMPEVTVNSGSSSLEIRRGTAANGNFDLPIEGTTHTANLKAGTISKVYASGSELAEFDKLVRLVFKGEANKKAAYLDTNGAYTTVSKLLTSDSFETAEKSLEGKKQRAVYVNVGDDLVVYTYLTSEWITIESPSSVVDEGGNIGGGGAGNVIVNGGGNKGTNNFYSADTTTPSIDNPFTDMVNHWAAADVLALNKAGIVSGVSDSLFEPERNITRAEFAAIIARALNLGEKAASYKDVSTNDWFAGYVGSCSDAGIISGFDGFFRPNDNITRQEMAVIIVNAYSYIGGVGASGSLGEFTDKSEIADWAKAAVDTASSVGLISGMGDGTFAPNANATRAQAASIVKRLLDK